MAACGDYRSLRDLIADRTMDLAALWTEFKPTEKLALFKLLKPESALELYGALDADEKYFLLCARDMNSIAPLLEGLGPESRDLFTELSEEHYERMLEKI